MLKRWALLADNGFDRLYKKLNYSFTDGALLAQALTHRSKNPLNNERLEFLGDSVLGLTISAELFSRFPDTDEGALTRLRARLVRKETLASLAREIGLGDYLRLGSGELKSGGFDRDSILADALEAIFGAAYTDGGIEAGGHVVKYLYRETLEAITPDAAAKDPKTQLQEYLQKKHLPLPVYNTLNIEGQAHHQTFLVECVVSGLEPVSGKGDSRRRAEQDAASRAYDKLDNE
ncbi:MAG: ribonuclease III [Proteobacteria bacterium]|nr:ribonuclease III [Pseudomonadota bacterium]